LHQCLQSILDKELNEDARRQSSNIRVPKPADIRHSLDQYVIGQDTAQKNALGRGPKPFQSAFFNSTATDPSSAFQPDPFADVEIEKSKLLVGSADRFGQNIAGKDAGKKFSMCRFASR